MILKGTAIRSRLRAARLANHLLKANDNDICEVVDIDGHARPDDLRSALCDYYDMVNLTNGDTGLFMVSINPEVGETMNEEHYQLAIERLEETFALYGLPKAIVRHHKEGREHYHVVWQTTNTDTKQIQAQIFRYNVKCKNLARTLEQELGHRVLGNEKSKTQYNEKERNQASRSGSKLKPDERKKLIQKLYARANDSKEFSRSIEKNGYVVAKGKVGLCLVEKDTGQVYNLEKELGKKVSQEQLQSFFEKQDQSIPDAAKLSNEKQKQLKQEKQDKIQDNIMKMGLRHAKYRILEQGKPQELEIKYTQAQAGKNSEDIQKDKSNRSAEQLANDYASNRDEIANDPKDEFKRKLREAQKNMRDDNENLLEF